MECVRAPHSLLIPEEVSAYEAMKLRLLDGGYCAVSYMAFLLGHREMDEAMADVRVAQFLRSYYAEVRVCPRSPYESTLLLSVERVRSSAACHFGLTVPRVALWDRSFRPPQGLVPAWRRAGFAHGVC